MDNFKRPSRLPPSRGSSTRSSATGKPVDEVSTDARVFSHKPGSLAFEVASDLPVDKHRLELVKREKRLVGPPAGGEDEAIDARGAKRAPGFVRTALSLMDADWASLRTATDEFYAAAGETKALGAPGFRHEDNTAAFSSKKLQLVDNYSAAGAADDGVGNDDPAGRFSDDGRLDEQLLSKVPALESLLDESQAAVERVKLFSACQLGADERAFRVPLRRLVSPWPSADRGNRELLLTFSSVEFDAGQFEPVFGCVALYDFEQRRKLTDSHWFHVGDKQSLDATLAAHARGRADDTGATVAMPTPYTSENVHLVVYVTKLLKGDLDSALEPYMKGASLKPKDRSKLTAEAKETGPMLGPFRQLLAWGVRRVFSSNSDLLLGKDSKIDLYRVRYDALKAAGIYGLAADVESRRLKPVPGGAVRLACSELAPEPDASQAAHEAARQAAAAGRPRTPLPAGRLSAMLAPVRPTGKTASIRELVPFPPDDDTSLVWPACEPVHVLFFSPVSADFSSHSVAGVSNVRNIAVRVQLLTAPGQPPSAAVFGGPTEPSLTTELFSTVAYHKQRPRWPDEFKLRLPMAMTPETHLLCTFYQVACDPKKLRKATAGSLASVATVVAYAAIPLYVNQEPSVAEDTAKVAAMHPASDGKPPDKYLEAARLIKDAGVLEASAQAPEVKWVNKGGEVFAYRTQLHSALYTTDRHVHRVWMRTSDWRRDPAGGAALLQRALKDLDQARPREIVRCLPLLAHTLFDIIADAEPPSSSSTAGGRGVASRHVSQRNSFNAGSASAGAGPAATATAVAASGAGQPGGGAPGAAAAAAASLAIDAFSAFFGPVCAACRSHGGDRVLDSFVAHGFGALSPHRLAAMHERLTLLGVAVFRSSANGQLSARNQLVLKNSAVFLGCLLKSLFAAVEFGTGKVVGGGGGPDGGGSFIGLRSKTPVAPQHKPLGDRASRFPTDFKDLLRELYSLACGAVRTQSESLFNLAKVLNLAVAQFTRDLLDVMDHAFVFSCVSAYVRQLTSGGNVSSSPSSSNPSAGSRLTTSLSLHDFKFLFLRVLTGHAHYFRMSGISTLPKSADEALRAPGSAPSVWLRRHFLPALFIHEIDLVLTELGSILRKATSAGARARSGPSSRSAASDTVSNKRGGGGGRTVKLRGKQATAAAAAAAAEAEAAAAAANSSLDALDNFMQLVRSALAAFAGQLRRHDLDGRLTDDADLRANVATLYFPYLVVCVDHVTTLAQLQSKADQRAAVVPALWILRALGGNSPILATWMRCDSLARKLSFVSLLRIAVRAHALSSSGAASVSAGGGKGAGSGDSSSTRSAIEGYYSSGGTGAAGRRTMRSGSSNLRHSADGSSSASGTRSWAANRDRGSNAPTLKLAGVGAGATSSLARHASLPGDSSSAQQQPQQQHSLISKASSATPAATKEYLESLYGEVGSDGGSGVDSSRDGDGDGGTGGVPAIKGPRKGGYRAWAQRDRHQSLPLGHSGSSASGGSSDSGRHGASSAAGTVAGGDSAASVHMTAECFAVILDVVAGLAMRFSERSSSMSKAERAAAAPVVPQLFNVISKILRHHLPLVTLLHSLRLVRSLVQEFRSVLFREQNDACAKLVKCLMPYTTARAESVRGAATALVVTFIRENQAEINNVSRMRLQSTIAVANLLRNAEAAMGRSVDSGASSQSSSSQSSSAGGAVRSLVRGEADLDRLRASLEMVVTGCSASSAALGAETRSLVDRLFSVMTDSRKISEFRWDPETTADLHWQVSQAYLDGPDLRIERIQSLAQYHKAKQHWEEAVTSNLVAAALVSRYMKLLGRFPQDMPDDFRRVFPAIDECLAMPNFEALRSLTGEICRSSAFSESGFVNLLLGAIEMLEAGKMYELAIETYRLLLPIYERRGNYRDQGHCHRELKKLCAQAAADEQRTERIFSKHYRVGFYGRAFGHLDGTETIYREPASELIADFSRGLQTQYGVRFGLGPPVPGEGGGVPLLPNSKSPDTLDPEKPTMQIIAVEPYFKDPDDKSVGGGGAAASGRATEFQKSFNVRRFVYETPFVPDGKPKESPAFSHIRQTILETETAFPSVRKRLLVVKKREVVLTPIEVAAEQIESKTRTLQDELNSPAPDTRRLQIVLNGSLLLQVNQGPLAIFRTFLGSPEEQASMCEGQPCPEWDPVQVERLRRDLIDFTAALGAGVELNQTLIGADQLPLQRELEDGFRKFCATVHEWSGGAVTVPPRRRLSVRLNASSVNTGGAGNSSSTLRKLGQSGLGKTK